MSQTACTSRLFRVPFLLDERKVIGCTSYAEYFVARQGIKGLVVFDPFEALYRSR
jgi:hypothetical protein